MVRYRFSQWADPFRLAKAAMSDCRNVGELTGGRFAATIIRGLSGSENQVWASPTFSCAAPVFAVTRAARGWDDQPSCTPENNTVPNAADLCALRAPAHDFGGWRNTVR